MRHPVSYIHDIDEVRSLQIATAKRALKTDLETAKLNLQKGIDSKAPKVDVENLKVRCPRITVLYSNAGHKTILGPFGPRMVLCPSGFLTFAFPKLAHLSGYSPLKSHMGVVNFSKIGAKSSSL